MNSMYKIWIPGIVVLVAVGCMYAIYAAGEAKYSQLARDNKAMQNDLTAARRAAEDEASKSTAWQKRCEEAEGRIPSLIKQLQATIDENARITKQSNENLRVAEENQRNLAESNRRTEENFQAALARRDERIRELTRQIADLSDERAEAQDNAARPLDGPRANLDDILDPKRVETHLAAYHRAWEKIQPVFIRGRFPEQIRAVDKNTLLNLYNDCIAQAIALKRLSGGDGMADEHLYDKLKSAYISCLDRGQSTRRSGTISPRTGRRSGRPGVSTASTVPQALDDLLDVWLAELKEQRKQAVKIPVQRKKGKEFKARIIQGGPLVR
ncbi:MAG: hypothetical protein JW849_12020 [Phycisphaerae bacterium]|nr:hypothetical protein [Phycisphaerae bacterium]